MLIEDNIINFYRKNFLIDKFPNHVPDLDLDDAKELEKCIKKTFVSTAGKNIENFNNKLKKKLNCKFIFSVNSGTSALHLSLLANKIGPNDEILLPSINYVAAANCVLYTGASPHFIEVKKKDLTIDFKKLDVYLSKFKTVNNYLYNQNTKKYIKSIIILHTYGYVADMDEAKELSKKYNLLLIEDAAESLGSYFKKKHTGTIGHCGILSFNGNKIITTGAGGSVISKSKKILNKVVHLSQVAKKKNKMSFDYDELGYNYKIPNLNASLGVSQLKKMTGILKKKRKLHMKYQKFFSRFDNIDLVQEKKNTKSNHWLNTIIINYKNINKKKHMKILKKLNDNGIEVRPMWKPLHKLTYLKKFPKMDLEITNYLQYRVFNLPSAPHIIENEIK